ncbi:MAG: hypothetical protein KBC96_15185 [Armatimonadetes bacterium]|nr:hypothetical protein [Armatimonadota bacterium]
MTTDELAGIVMQRIDDLGGGYSFVEMKRDLSRHINVDGDIAIECRPNCILWGNVSQAVFEVFDQLWRSETILLKRVSPMIYVLDGVCSTLPIVKREPKRGYKKPHWLPVVMCRNDRKEEQ